MIEIREAVSKKDIKKFVDFPQKLYKGNPYFVPYLRMDEVNIINPEKNPALEDCKAKCFLAYRDGELCGRVMGIVHYGDIKRSGIKRIRFSRIDFINDVEVARALLNAVEELGRAEGLEYIHGPLDFNDLGREGMLIEGFDRMSTFETQYSYEYYPVIMEKIGFKKDVDWIEHLIKCPKKMDERIERLSQKVLERFNLRIARYSKREFIKRYALKFFEMLDKSYTELYATVPLPPKVIDSTVKSFKLIADKRLVCCVVDKDDTIVAGGLALPSIAKAVQKSKGRLLPFGIFRLLWAIKRYSVVDLALIGVLPEYRNKGLNSIIITEIVKGAISRKVVDAESNHMLEDNTNIQAQNKFMEHIVHKRRRAYVKPIE